jgi:hypothetical protein
MATETLTREIEQLLASMEADAEETAEAKKWLASLATYTDRPAGLPTTPPEFTRMGWR